MELQRLISNCDRSIKIISPCLKRAYENFFGSDYQNEVVEKINMSRTAIDGIDAMSELTGCKRPCKKSIYKDVKLSDWNLASNREERVDSFINNNSSSIVVIMHELKRVILKLEEKPRYTIISFISDIGGICGVFLGISFWSIYEVLVVPLLKKMQGMIFNVAK